VFEWIANYKDGSSVCQKDGFKYPSIDRSRLKSFDLLKDNKLVLRMNLSLNQKLIYRRRVQKKLLSKETFVVYIVGWQQNISGVNVQHIHIVYPDSSIETINKWGDRLYFCPNFKEYEL